MKIQPVSNQDIQPHSIGRSLVLHLLPGVFVLLFFLLVSPIVKNFGLPIRFAAISSIFLILIPVELGFLLYEGKKLNGKLSLKGIVVYQEKISIWQYFLWVPLLVIWSSALALLLSPFADILIKTVFSWLPDWFIFTDNIGSSKIVLVVMVTIYGIGNVSAAIVEELYFRGYLLPRLPLQKNWPPFINSVLFALQHFLTPWQVPFIILGMIPQAYLVFKKRNLLLGILAHSILNLLSSILFVLSVFG